MGRKKEFPEKRVASFPEGTMARIAAVLNENEDRTEFIRDAVESTIRFRHLERRPQPNRKSLKDAE